MLIDLVLHCEDAVIDLDREGLQCNLGIQYVKGNDLCFSCVYNSIFSQNIRLSEIKSLEHLTVCSYHVTYMFQSESTLCGCLNVKELLVRNRCEIWSLSDCNCTRTHNHLVHKQALSHLVKLATFGYWWSINLQTKWFWVRVQLQSLEYLFDRRYVPEWSLYMAASKSIS